MKIVSYIFLLLLSANINAQTLGSNAVFNFLKLPNTPQLTALGGVNITSKTNDVGMAFNNPALLSPTMHTQMNAVFNGFYGGIKAYHLAFGYHHEKLKTNFAYGLHYLSYGEATETDASGNVLGLFRPVDWVMQASASKTYQQKWSYGVTMKFINSRYGQYNANGLAFDVGILFTDTVKLFNASILAKNIGTQLKKYEGSLPDDLPFDIQAGITKRLAKAPFSFSITAHRMHQYDVLYNDTAFNNANGFTSAANKKFSISKLINHLVLASTIHISDRVEAMAGYNFLRRKELNIGNSANGLNGFSLGAGFYFDKLQVRYARAYYQSNSAYNQLGITLKLNQYFGLGKLGRKIGW